MSLRRISQAKRYLIVRRKAHRRKGYYKDVKPGPGYKKGYIKPTTVKATTYKTVDRGKPGRGKKVIKIKPGRLRKYGYSTFKSTVERRKALRKADRAYGSVRLWRMLNAQVVLRKNTRGRAYRIFKSDRDWVMRNLMTKSERRSMTKPAVKEWKSMSPRERAKAMPGG